MDLPSGTVTFLFTDIVGSTQSWEQHPQTMHVLLARHDALLREAIDGHGGVVVKMMGDGLHAVFDSAADAVQAALAAQRALAAEQWQGVIERLMVRIALHSGTAELRDGDYYGPAVNRAARLVAIGHGGQILLSAATQKLVKEDLPDNTAIMDLGKYRLRDIVLPEQVYQLSAADLPAEFPPLRSLAPQLTNLPTPPTPFIGREGELKAVVSMLQNEDVSLVTLTGPGGMGKTRLALQVGVLLQPSFEDGVYFVDLAPVSDPELLAPSIATVLGIGEAGGVELADLLKQYLHNKKVLLIVDNLEHLMSGLDLGFFSDILAAAPAVKLLLTSREIVNLQEEWLYPLDGLAYPSGPEDGMVPEAYSAVHLFDICARRVRPGFSLAEQIDGVIRICKLVKGMPLAIELAASWIKTIPVAEIAAEIQRNMDFLVTKLRNVPERHQSMQAVFQQSWKMLDEQERAVLKRLSVFRGGFERQAAEKVAGTSLLTLSELVDKSILRRAEDGRYHLHGLLRQYAAKKLSVDESKEAGDRHSDYYASFLEGQLPDLLGGGQVEALANIDAEIENVRTAWHWTMEQANAEALYRSAESFALYYFFRNRYQQGRYAFERAAQSLHGEEAHEQAALARIRIWFNLAWMYIRLGQQDKAEEMSIRCHEAYNRLQIPLLVGQGSDPSLISAILALIRGEYEVAGRLGEEVLQRSELENHLWNRQFAYYVLAQTALGQGEYENARQHAQAALETTEQTEDLWFRAYFLNDLGRVALAGHDYAGAKAYYEDSYVLREAFNDPEGMAVALNHLADVAMRQHAYAEAEESYQRSREIYEEIGDKGGLATSLNGLANRAVAQGDLATARDFYREALGIASAIEYRPLTLSLLIGIGKHLQQAGQRERCVELLTVAAGHPAAEEETRTQAREALKLCQADLAPQQFADAAQRGRESDLDTAVASLLLELNKPISDSGDMADAAFAVTPASANETLAEPLTPRELEVLQLIAGGLTNRQIAGQLFIAVGTVKSYTSQIYSKLYVSSRTQAVARARELTLI